MSKLEAGTPSPVIALGDRFAVLWLVDKIDGSRPPLPDVREALAAAVRTRSQRMKMEQLAREMLAEADVIVLDAVLKSAWERERKQIARP